MGLADRCPGRGLHAGVVYKQEGALSRVGRGRTAMNGKCLEAIPWWAWGSWGLALALGILAYPHLPVQIVGQAHRATPRFEVVFYEPALMLAVMLLWQVLWRIDPKRRNYREFWAAYRFIGGVVVVGMGVVYLTVLGHALQLATLRFAPTAVGAIFLLIARALPRLRPNWWVGVRTPWTLSSEQSWHRTHELGGKLALLVGALIVVLAWVLPANWMLVVAVAAPILGWTLILVVASYYFAQRPNRPD